LVRPPLWLRVPVATGVAIQVGASAMGALLIAVACALPAAGPAGRELSLGLGFLLIYLNTHALGHYLVGRAVGIRFRGFGMRGTDHPENYPPGLRQIMSFLPMWAVLTEPSSRRSAGRRAQAAMWAAGETSTTLCSIAAAGTAALAGAPWGQALLVVSVLWNLGASVVVTRIQKGDYAKALRALRAG
ncbi:hypothetical protein B1B_10094, partial [mine drainage metagenome]